MIAFFDVLALFRSSASLFANVHAESSPLLRLVNLPLGVGIDIEPVPSTTGANKPHTDGKDHNYTG